MGVAGLLAACVSDPETDDPDGSPTTVCDGADCQSADASPAGDSSPEDDAELPDDAAPDDVLADDAQQDDASLPDATSDSAATLPAHCSNELLDEQESDTDCGGAECAKCPNNYRCGTGSDCGSGRCDARHRCVTPRVFVSSCAGRIFQEACASSDSCTNYSCRQDRCRPDFWQVPISPCGTNACDLDSRQRVPVTDGTACGWLEGLVPGCYQGTCMSGTCQEHAVPDHCLNDRLDEKMGETDIDCGGSCSACADSRHCLVGGDCINQVCDDTNHCKGPIVTSCEGWATGTKCVGPGSRCSAPGFCDGSGVCVAGAAPSCAEGPCMTGTCDPVSGDCAPKPDGTACTRDGASGMCQAGRCEEHQVRWTCQNGRKDKNETDLDCGGECSGCAVAKVCNRAEDCTSGACNQHGTCMVGPVASCSGQPNDVTCQTQEACRMARCWEGQCQPNSLLGCPVCHSTCSLVTQQCVPDPDGTPCLFGDAESSGRCQDTRCEAHQVPSSCQNGRQDAEESGVDCGGAQCSPCPEGGACRVGTDCQSSLCAPNFRCVRPATIVSDCTDPANNNRRCQSNDPCQKSLCRAGQCEPREGSTEACDNQPCKLAACDPNTLLCLNAPDGLACQVSSGAAGTCSRGECAQTYPAHCADGARSGDESDVDCGGSCRGCPPCDMCRNRAGHRCRTKADCAEGGCTGAGLCSNGSAVTSCTASSQPGSLCATNGCRYWACWWDFQHFGQPACQPRGEPTYCNTECSTSVECEGSTMTCIPRNDGMPCSNGEGVCKEGFCDIPIPPPTVSTEPPWSWPGCGTP